VLLNGWLLAAVWAIFSGARALSEPHHIFLFGVLVLVTLQANLNLGRCLWLSVKFARDLRFKTAVIVRSPALVPKEPRAGIISLLPADEFLAVSGVLWTRGGSPAPWRLVPGR
jgi:hypothetical protein